MKDTIDLFRIRLRNLMNSSGMTQDKFSKHIGITPAALSQIYDGKRVPSFQTILKINNKTGASIDYLLGLK